MKHVGYSYDHLAWFYDGLAHVGSLGQIYALKRAQIAEMESGSKALYVGVGSGDDAVLAAKSQARVTVLDLSPRMLDRASRQFNAAGVNHSIEVICADVLTHQRPGYYDVVVANFFLNVFGEVIMQRVLAHLVTLLKPGGKLIIGDYSIPRGSFPRRIIQRGYFYLSTFSFWLARGSTLHPIYDYPQYFCALNLRTLAITNFQVAVLFPASFATITAVKESVVCRLFGDRRRHLVLPTPAENTARDLVR